MPNRRPSNRRRTSVARNKKSEQMPLSPNSRRKSNERSKICMRKLRKNWNNEQKIQNREDSKMRQRKRRERDVRVRKPYQKVRENLKNRTVEEIKKIRAAQRKLQRQYHDAKAKTTVEYETFMVEQEEEEEQVEQQVEEQMEEQVEEQMEEQVEEQMQLNSSTRMKKSLSLESAVASFLKYEKGKSKEQRVMLETIRKETEGSSERKKLVLCKHLQVSYRRLLIRKLAESRGRKATNDLITSQVKEFYKLNSRPLPLKSRTNKVDQRVLETTIKDLYSKFVVVYSTSKISLTTFSRMRPTNVQCISTKDFLTCLCEECLIF